MIGYVTLGTNDLPRAAAFYDALLGGDWRQRRLMDDGRGYSYGDSPDKPTLAIATPYDTRAATANGTMVALALIRAPRSTACTGRPSNSAAPTKAGGPAQGRFYAGFFRT